MRMDAIVFSALVGLLVALLVGVTFAGLQSKAETRARSMYLDTVKAVNKLDEAIRSATRRINADPRVFFLPPPQDEKYETLWMVPADVLFPLIDIRDKYYGWPLTSELMTKETKEANERKAAAKADAGSQEALGRK